MAVKHLPETITKDVLMMKAFESSAHWAKLYGDPAVSAQYLYEDMSCSVFSGDPNDDFPDEVKAEQDSIIRYQYSDKGACSFMIDGIKITVFDLRDMRKDPSIGTTRYSDMCTLAIDYRDDSDMFVFHLIPDAWLYGSTSDDFDEGKPVDDYFIKAARKYIEEHHITKEMQEVEDDDD